MLEIPDLGTSTPLGVYEREPEGCGECVSTDFSFMSSLCTSSLCIPRKVQPSLDDLLLRMKSYENWCSSAALKAILPCLKKIGY